LRARERERESFNEPLRVLTIVETFDMSHC
jgi:hypothetical protein